MPGGRAWRRWRAGAMAMMLLAAGGATAQDYSVVGNGTGSNDYWQYPSPMGNYNWGNRTQLFVSGTELAAAGIPVNAFISSIGFNVTNVNGCAPLTNWYLRVYTTTASDPITANWHSGTPVATTTPTTYQPVAGWNQRPLNASFVWNGTDNLVIETCSNNNGWTNNTSIQWTTTLNGPSVSRWNMDDTPNVCSSNGLDGTSTAIRPNVRFQWEGPACAGTPNPGGTTGPAEVCEGHSFTLGLANGGTDGGLSFQWYASTNGGGTYSPVGGNTRTYTGGLTQNAVFYCTVTCANSGLSTNSTPKTVSLPTNPCAVCDYPSYYALNALRGDITNVTVGTLNNSSACNALAPGAGSVAGRYGNYAGAVAIPDLEVGSQVSFSLTSSTCTPPGIVNAFQIYIDWNQDGDFLDDGERVYSATGTVSGGHTETGTFEVPLLAKQGIARMRVVNVENPVLSNNYAQMNYNVGETEDYCIRVVGSACTGQPAAGVVVTPVSTCQGTTVTLTATGLTTGPGISYRWKESPNGVSGWTNVVGGTGGTTASYTTTAITGTRYFRLATGCAASGQTNNTNVVTVNLAPETSWYADADGDGYGDPATMVMACLQPAGYVADNTDNCPNLYGRVGDACDDGNPNTGDGVIQADCTCSEAVFVSVELRALLEGPYVEATGRMHDLLRAGTVPGVTYPLVPHTQPYDITPFNYHGTEEVDASVMAVTGDNAIVDWVMVELRSKTAPANILHRRAALIQRDGDIVDVDGVTPLHFLGVAQDDYYIAVRHRNHLGIMTAGTYTLSATSAPIDLTLASTPVHGTLPRKAVGSKMLLWCGNAVPDNVVKYTGVNNDRDPILTEVGGTPTNVIAGYLNQDVNLDGQTKYAGAANDRDRILSNLGSTSPTFARQEQLP